MKLYVLILTAAVFLQGCAVVTPKDSFDQVAQTISSRTGKRITWNQGVVEDKEVQRAVETLLEKELLVDDAVQIALLNSPKLQSMYEEIGVSQADLVQAGLLKNPIFYSSKRFPGKAFEFDLLQSFFEVFLIPLKTKLAEAELESTKHRLTSEILDYIAAVKGAFFDLQKAIQLLEMEQHIATATEASFDTTKKLYEAGNTSLLEVADEADFAAQARLAVATTQGEIIQERERLNILMGLWGHKTSWKIASRLPHLPTSDPDGAGLESLAISKRGDLLALKRQIEAVMAGRSLGGLDAFLAGLAIGGHYEQEPDGLGTSGPDISIPLPLFDQGIAQFAKGDALVRKALKDYQQLALTIRSEVRSRFSEMQVARRKADYYFKEVLPIQERRLEQTQLRYNAMLVGVFNLLKAKQQQIETGKNYLETLKNYWHARTELEKVVGGSIEGVPTSMEEGLQPELIPLRSPEKISHHHHGA